MQKQAGIVGTVQCGNSVVERDRRQDAGEEILPGLQFANGPLEDGDLCGRITGRFQFVADLILEIG